jgi:hypothetical protein
MSSDGLVIVGRGARRGYGERGSRKRAELMMEKVCAGGMIAKEATT